MTVLFSLLLLMAYICIFTLMYLISDLNDRLVKLEKTIEELKDRISLN